MVRIVGDVAAYLLKKMTDGLGLVVIWRVYFGGVSAICLFEMTGKFVKLDGLQRE